VLHADANNLMTKLNELLGLTGGAAGGGAAGGRGRPTAPPAPGAPPGAHPTGGDDVGAAIPSKILVDERTNTLIVVASEAGYLRVKALVERLDIALDTEGGSSIHVYPLDNALAEELAQTLNNAMGQGSQQQRRPGQPGAPGQPAGGAPAPQAPPPPVATNPAEGNFGASLEGQVRVIGDKPTNSLIVTSSGRDYLAVKDVIRRLDQPRRQVFIEAMVLEVQLSKETDIGTSSHGGLPTSGGSLILGGVQTANLRSLDLTSLISATGLIGGIIGAPLTNSQTFLGTSIPSYGILFQALANQANTDVLSTPHIIAVNNEKAEFSVGNNVPYKSGLSFGGIGLPGATGTTGGGLPAGAIGQNIQREKLDLTLNVTPHISSDDVVRLEIEQETKDIGDKDPELGPTWTERKLKTQVIVHDQQSVVIGGLIQEHDVYNVTKVPLLGDIPLLGYLFKFTTKSKKKTNLLVLLTPYIIKDQLDLQSIRERKLREREEFVRSFSSLNAMKYEPTVDYRRKRGVVEEINRSILAVEQDLETLQQLGKRQRVIEGPIEYVPPNPDDDDGHHKAPPPPKGKK
jgi:general secretion pathway protein D